MTPTWIARQRVILVHPDGRREQGHIALGRPYVLGSDEAFDDPGFHYEAKCPVEITGLHRAAHAPSGAGTLSALSTAMALVRVVLETFVERGGRVLEVADEHGSELELDVEKLFNSLAGTRVACDG